MEGSGACCQKRNAFDSACRGVRAFTAQTVQQPMRQAFGRSSPWSSASKST